MNISTIVSKVPSLSKNYEVKVNLSELSQDIIESPKISGLYLGWMRKDTHKWEPLLKLMVVEGGYTAEHIGSFEEISTLYPGYKGILLGFELKGINEDFPHIFNNRMPLLREDVRSECEFLKLDYPQINKMAYVSRRGGRICGDPFSICPIIEPDVSGSYTFYCTLDEVEDIDWNRENWNEIRNQTEGFQLVKVDGRYNLELQGRVLGCLEDYFNLIDGEMISIEIVNFTDMKKWQGRGILLKIVIHSDNAYSHKLFQTLKLVL
jgi:hypothetical protein